MRFRMNSPEGKAILSLVREGDYAHPGEEEAIVRVASNLDQSAIQRVLDVGCGRGGTARWFQQHGWGNVVGIDIDAESIEEARRHYPRVEYHACDVADLGRLQLEPFDLAYLLTSFYAFPDQQRALCEIRSACNPGARLCLFDYTQPFGGSLQAAVGGEIGKPIVLETLHVWMKAADWEVISTTDMTRDFLRWYDVLLHKISRYRQAIVRAAGNDWYDYVASFYSAVRDALALRHLGGVLVLAEAAAGRKTDG